LIRAKSIEEFNWLVGLFAFTKNHRPLSPRENFLNALRNKPNGNFNSMSSLQQLMENYSSTAPMALP